MKASHGFVIACGGSSINIILEKQPSVIDYRVDKTDRI